ncbi:hypothetical protein BV898_18565 [Hypsibius exemplaris]|uniref:Gustatory receptor n=1 Tax=Hypsibius exemplaris TaxID=2072580 RepID=A0A9X6NJ16_HYPEX|nr:hypothetical protein BV898_18565 [Hypsibius exemplaris]
MASSIVSNQQNDGHPSYMPHIITALGLLPLTDILAKGPDGRKVKFSTVCHLIYWTICSIFTLIEITSSTYMTVTAIAMPTTDNPLLEALLEASFAFQMFRGPVFCVFIVVHCKAGIRRMVQKTEGLIVRFALPNSLLRKVRLTAAALVAVTSIIVATIAAICCAKLHFTYPNSPDLRPEYSLLPADLMSTLFIVLSFAPELLARFTVVLVVASGMILLACVKVMRKKVCQSGGVSLHVLQSSRCQYYALARALSAISEPLGGMLAFSILSDFVPICGRVTRSFFSIRTHDSAGDLIQKLSDVRSVVESVSGIGFYLVVMYSPFVLLHRELEKDKQLNESELQLDKLLHAMEQQPLALTLLHGFQIRENFCLVIATVLSSYLLICYQLLKDSSQPTENIYRANCTS